MYARGFRDGYEGKPRDDHAIYAETDDIDQYLDGRAAGRQAAIDDGLEGE